MRFTPTQNEIPLSQFSRIIQDTVHFLNEVLHISELSQNVPEMCHSKSCNLFIRSGIFGQADVIVMFCPVIETLQHFTETLLNLGSTTAQGHIITA